MSDMEMVIIFGAIVSGLVWITILVLGGET